MKTRTSRSRNRRTARPFLGAAVGAIQLGATRSPVADTNIDLYATADAFVFTGSADPVNYYDAMDRNFGAMNSRQAAGPGTAKGEFQSVIRFDSSAVAAGLDSLYGPGNWTVLGLALTLVTSQRASGGGIFNNEASGSFAVSWMPEDDGWLQGGGTRNLGTAVDHDPAGVNFTSGIPWNDLAATLADDPAVSLATVSCVTAGTLAPATYVLGSGTTELRAALEAGESVSLLLTAAQSTMAFNFTSQSYGGSGADAYDPRLSLSVGVVPEPATALLLMAGLAGIRVLRRRDRRGGSAPGQHGFRGPGSSGWPSRRGVRVRREMQRHRAGLHGPEVRGGSGADHAPRERQPGVQHPRRAVGRMEERPAPKTRGGAGSRSWSQGFSCRPPPSC